MTFAAPARERRPSTDVARGRPEDRAGGSSAARFVADARYGGTAMGEDIDRERFGPADFHRFRRRLADGLTALGELLARPGFGEGPASVGAELEMALIDDSGRPAGNNAEIRDAVAGAQVALEVGRFSIETETPPFDLAGRPFSAIADSMRDAATRIDTAARGFGARVAMVGTLPTLTLADLGPGGLTASARYRALEAGLDALKGDHTIAISGRERLEVELPGIVAEAANAAFQVHLKVAPADFARTLNAAQIATGPVLAVAGNSPTFLGQVLWEETRVPVFHQSVDGVDRAHDSWRPDRVSFGHGWVRSGALELFAESVALHPALLPLSSAEEPLAALAGGGVPELNELRLHHGTTWRWNRAVFDPSDGGHVRIEFRALPSGPSIADMAANAAFLVGLTLALADEEWMLNAVPFRCVRRNFFEAARRGMDAELLWPDSTPPSPQPETAPALVEHLVDMARRALVAAGVDHDEADTHLEPIRRRTATGVTGSSWQREAIEAAERRGAMRGRALATMLDAYLEASASGEPIHSWPSPAAVVA